MQNRYSLRMRTTNVLIRVNIMDYFECLDQNLIRIFNSKQCSKIGSTLIYNQTDILPYLV